MARIDVLFNDFEYNELFKIINVLCICMIINLLLLLYYVHNYSIGSRYLYKMF